MQHRVSLEIDLDKLENNFKSICSKVAPAAVMAVVKANAYGLGVQRIAPLLKKSGASFFGVADVNEAMEIQHFGLPVQVLGGLLDEEIADAVKIDLVCPLNDFEHAARINAEAAKQNKIVRGSLTIDSGMGRIGMIADNAFNEIVKIKNELKNIELFGIYSHFSTAWKLNDDYTLSQLEKLSMLSEKLKNANIDLPYIYIGASSGIANYGKCFSMPYNMVRAGINMYGYCDSWQLENVAEFKSKLIAVRKLPSGSCIGYNKLYKLEKDSLVGTVCAGYADGVPLALTNKGHVLINGVKAPIIGRISMDYTTVLLNDVPDAEAGDEAVFFGRQQNAEISIREWAANKGTHLHDILCAIGPRVKRIYKYTELKND